MQKNELHKLGKTDLLSIIYNQQKEINTLKEEISGLNKKLEDRSINITEAGSIAEASLKLNDIFAKAQAAADEYLENIKKANDNNDVIQVKGDTTKENINKSTINDETLEIVEENKINNEEIENKPVEELVAEEKHELIQDMADNNIEEVTKEEIGSEMAEAVIFMTKNPEVTDEVERPENDEAVIEDEKETITEDSKTTENVPEQVEMLSLVPIGQLSLKKNRMKWKEFKEKLYEILNSFKEKILEKLNKVLVALKEKKKQSKVKWQENKEKTHKNLMSLKENISNKAHEFLVIIKKKKPNIIKLKQSVGKIRNVFLNLKEKIRKIPKNVKNKIEEKKLEKELEETLDRPQNNKSTNFFKNLFTKKSEINLKNIEIDLDKLEKEIHNRKAKENKVKFAKTLTYSGVIVVAITIIAATRVFNVLQVSGNSMEPSLYAGELLISTKVFGYKKGDIIAFYYNDSVLIKRIVATEGDVIDIDDQGIVYVNSQKLEEEYVKDLDYGKCDITFPYRVPDKEVFVLGDNREVSIDSRSKSIGSIAEEKILGKIEMKLNPFVIY